MAVSQTVGSVDVVGSYSRIHNHFQLRRHRLTATAYRTARDGAFRTWRDVTVVAVAA